MCCRTVMLVLLEMSSELQIDNPAERHKPECEPPHNTLSNLMSHKLLSKSRCLDRCLLLNPRESVIDLLFGEQAAFEIFLHATLLVDEDAHG